MLKFRKTLFATKLKNHRISDLQNDKWPPSIKGPPPLKTIAKWNNQI